MLDLKVYANKSTCGDLLPNVYYIHRWSKKHIGLLTVYHNSWGWWGMSSRNYIHFNPNAEQVGTEASRELQVWVQPRQYSKNPISKTKTIQKLIAIVAYKCQPFFPFIQGIEQYVITSYLRKSIRKTLAKHKTKMCGLLMDVQFFRAITSLTTFLTFLYYFLLYLTFYESDNMLMRILLWWLCQDTVFSYSSGWPRIQYCRSSWLLTHSPLSLTLQDIEWQKRINITRHEEHFYCI